MINYEALQNWTQTRQERKSTQNLLITTILKYYQTHDRQYLEQMTETMRELNHLITLEKQYYSEAFTS